MISYADRQSFDIRDILRKTERLAETGPFVGNRLTIHPDDTGAGVSVEIAFFVRRRQDSTALQRKACIYFRLLPEVPVVDFFERSPVKSVIIVQLRSEAAGAEVMVNSALHTGHLYKIPSRPRAGDLHL